MSTEAMAAAIAVLRVAYPGDFTDETVAYYAAKLADQNPADVVAAIDRLTNRMRFRPTVADIRLEVADAHLELPNLVEAWAIAEHGDLRVAPACVREALDYVGGRWAIATSENPATLRAQFRQAYERTREQALLEAAGGAKPRPVLPTSTRLRLAPPAEEPDGFVPMPRVLARMLVHDQGLKVDPPDDEVRAEALAILKAGPRHGAEPHEDMLYRAAELVMAHASEAD